MHFAFIPYGARHELELLFRDMESQKFKLTMTKKGKKDVYVWIPGQIRTLPLGVVEYIFPREYKDTVLNTILGGSAPNRFGIPKMFVAIFRKALKLKKIPKYKQKDKFIWIRENVSIAPIGIRDDAELVEPKDMGYKGYLHEAI